MSLRQLGRQPAQHDPNIPLLSALDGGATALPPASVNWYAAVGEWPMLANDQVGNCVEAAVLHEVAQRHKYVLARQPVSFTDRDAIRLYGAWTGYNPANPATDQGTIMSAALRLWMRNGVPLPGGGVDRITAIARVDPRHADLLHWLHVAIWRCGGALLGIRCPHAWLTETGILDVAGRLAPDDIAGGHCVFVNGRLPTARGVEYDTITWGGRFRMTERALLEVVEEGYAILDRDWYDAAGHDPAGIDYATAAQAMHTLLA